MALSKDSICILGLLLNYAVKEKLSISILLNCINIKTANNIAPPNTNHYIF